MKPTPQAIESAARAIAERHGFADWCSTDMYLDLAKAALSADLGDMVLVPKEPSWRMKIEGRDAILSDDDDLDLSTDDADACYRAMLAAAEDSNDQG